MKLFTAFLLSIVASSCASTSSRTWWPAPAESNHASPAARLSATPVVARAAAPQHAHDEHHSARIALLLGMRTFDEDDYEPVENQPMLGIDFSYEPPGSFSALRSG